MFDTALGVAIGLVLVFLVFSMVVSGIYEGIARFLAWRAKDLWASVRLLRAATTVAAKELVASCDDKTGADLDTCLADARVSLDDQVTMPVGWGSADDGRSFCRWGAVGWMLGWLLTAVALMQGGPFWFDVLKRATSRAPASEAGGAGTSRRA